MQVLVNYVLMWAIKLENVLCRSVTFKKHLSPVNLFGSTPIYIDIFGERIAPRSAELLF